MIIEIPKEVTPEMEAEWLKHCEENGYTNDGTTGWFPDAIGNLHYFNNIHYIDMQEPTKPIDKALFFHNLITAQPKENERTNKH